MRRFVAPVVVALVLAGCAEKKHLEAVEAGWSSLPPASAPAEERLKALEAFLLRYPPSHEYGNPRAEEAQERITELKLAIRAEELKRAELQKVAAAQAAARSLSEQHIFTLLVEVDAGRAGALLLPTPWLAAPVRASLEETRALTRHRFAAHTVYARPAAELVEEAQRAVGQMLRQNPNAPVDPEALKALLDGLWVGPDDPLLGTTAKEVYPYFRPFLREQLLLLRALDEAGMDAVKKSRKAYLARTGQLEDPSPDLIAFYQELTKRTGLLGAYWNALDREGAYVDVGFWLRREADQSLPSLRAFLARVVEAYDPELHAELKTDTPTAELAPAVDAPPDDEERPWAPSPLTGDRLIRAAPPADFRGRSAAWSPTGTVLALQDIPDRVRLIDAKSGEQRVISIPGEPRVNAAVAPRFSPDGAQLYVAARGKRVGRDRSVERPAQILAIDVERAEIVGQHAWDDRAEIWSFAAHPRGEGFAVANFTRAAWISTTPGADGGPTPETTLPGAWAVDLNPSGTLAVVGGRVASLVALPSGEKLADYSGLKNVGGVAFSPDGARVLLTSRDGARAHLVRVDDKQRALVREAVLGDDQQTAGDWLDDGNVLLFSAAARRATSWRLSDRARGASVVGSALLAVDRARRRALLDARTDDVVLYSLDADSP